MTPTRSGITGRPLKILFTEGSSLSARHSLFALGGRHTIDLIDPNPLCQCRFSRHVRRYRKSPHYAKQPTEFLQFLAELLKQEQYDVVLPTHEQVYLFSRFRQIIGQATGLALPDFATIERMLDKASFIRTLDELEMPYPETVVVSTIDQLRGNWKYPIFLKIAYSTAGQGVFYIRNEEELAERIRAIKQAGMLDGAGKALVQQPARGNQATVQAVFDQGQMMGIHLFDARRLGVGGMSSARTSADHPLVREQVQRLGEHLKWHGALFLDYFYDYETGRPEYLECNPRIGETVSAWLAGANLCELLVRIAAGEQVEPLELGTIGLPTQSFLMILISMAYNGASRRELWRELLQFRRGEGMYAGSEDELTRPRDDRGSILPYWWIAMQLLAWPKRARAIVAGTVDDYALPQSSAEAIKLLDLDPFRRLFVI